MNIITVYDLLEVKEDASKEEIEKSYLKLVNEYKIDPNQSQEIINQNELILKKLKLAYDILCDDEKRKKYDNDLAQKRAEELIKNVVVKPNEPKEEKKQEIKPGIVQNNIQENIKENVQNNIQENTNIKYKEVEKSETYEDRSISEIELTDIEKKNIKKAAEKELKYNIKKIKKAEEEYNRAYNEAYNDYLRKMGYSVKEPWTLKRIRNLLIAIFAIIFIGLLIWILPPTRNLIIKIYEENYIVKSFVDIVVMLFEAIMNTFK